MNMSFQEWQLAVRRAFEKAGLDILLITEDEQNLFDCGYTPEEMVNMFTPDTEGEQE